MKRPGHKTGWSGWGRNDGGFVMVTVLLLLLVLTLIGLAAMTTSTVENMLSGNIRLREANLSLADAAATVSAPAIEYVIREEESGDFGFIGNAAAVEDLVLELRTCGFAEIAAGACLADTQDFTLDLGGETASVDVDKMYTKTMGGSSVEFASGYEGFGKGSASGTYTYFRINSVVQGAVGSEARVGMIYRYVPK